MAAAVGGESGKGDGEDGIEGSGEDGGGKGGSGGGKRGDEGGGSGTNGTGTVRPPTAAAASTRSAEAHCRGIFMTVGPPALISLRPIPAVSVR